MMNAAPNFWHDWPKSAVDELIRMNRLHDDAHAVSDMDDIIGERDGLAHFIAQAIRGLDALSPQEALARLRELDYHAGYMVNAPSEPPLPPPPECLILSAVELPPVSVDVTRLLWAEAHGAAIVARLRYGEGDVRTQAAGLWDELTQGMAWEAEQGSGR